MGPKILLVESDPIHMMAEQASLEIYGCTVFAVSTAEDARVAAGEEAYDCAIIGIRLTGSKRDGIRLAQMFRDLLAPSMAIILTGSGKTDFTRTADAVADVCLEKSNLDQLPRAIETSLWQRGITPDIAMKMCSATSSLWEYKKALTRVYRKSSRDGAELLHGTTRDKRPVVWDVYNYLQEEEKRIIIAVASSIGCVYDCKFCKSGVREWERPIMMEEMIAQVYHGLRAEHVRYIWERNAKVVINWTTEGDVLASGPKNMKNGCEAVQIISKSLGGMDHGFIFTTVGNVPMLRLFHERYADVNVELYVSFHAAIQEKRESIMPIAANQPMPQLRDALYDIMAATGFKRRVTIAIMVIKGFNDGREDACALRALLGDRPFRIKVQSIENRSLEGAPRTTMQDAERFAELLRNEGFKDVRVRRIVGLDIGASCGHTVPR